MGNPSQETFAKLSEAFVRTEVNRMERGGYAFTSQRQLAGIARATGLSETDVRRYLLAEIPLDHIRGQIRPPKPLETGKAAPWWATERLRHPAARHALEVLHHEGVEADFLRAFIRHANEVHELPPISGSKPGSADAWLRYARAYLPSWRERRKTNVTLERWNRRPRGKRLDKVVMVAIQSAYAEGEVPFRPWPDVVARYQRIYRDLRSRVTPALPDLITPLEVARAAAPFSEVA